MKINKQQRICNINDCYKSISFITEEFVSNKVLWTCEKHKDLLNNIKDKTKKQFYQKLENSKIIFDYETGLLKLKFYKT
ncbi:MAG: hypothetical protein EIB84_06795 [Spiroplasma poulsonii]|uniref:Uncharacterized protein n=1 Tax=Spiroplasma poulsonii TaxID=2138 RepID=A0A2P6FFV7_9MOLU|nr:hypothetical protein [Spiroplasma poulsonii]KAF0850153.1 hypothetical protein MSROBK_022660 [Spiroplasma poulsonii]MBW1242454.1 hypothetical protein [Spiroplasma poulsonii]PQM32331.1 hypothetical protein SMSRO_SF022390 [Spiroplasma poulsonii]PWF94986.1 hypothetical protein SMSE_04100 [Spiroplasma poulsonii]PWF97780.1 hypothetical protein SMH99_03290 [Spiroplasma poulsonii]